MTQLTLYTTEDGRSQIKLRAQEQTVWLTQLEMAELFEATKQNISLHLKNVFEDGELNPAATVKEPLTVQIEVGRMATHVAADHFRGATKMIARDRGAIAMGVIGSARP